MITTGAMFAFSAPAAQANLDRILPAKASAAHHKVVAKNHKTSGNHSTPAKHKASTGLIYIYFPGTPTQASATSITDDCAQSGNNCTDEQLCITWGMNCELATSTPAAVADSPVLPAVEILLNDSPPVQTDPVASSTDNIYTDNSLSYEDC
jgi:hypothetical protein